MASIDEEYIMLLDMDKVFSSDEITELSINTSVADDKVYA
jgi:hypothetical protein